MLSASLGGQIVEQVRAVPLLDRAFRGVLRIEDTQRVDLHVGFVDRLLDFGLGVAAVIVPAVGEKHDRFPRIPGVLHLSHRQMEGVEQRGTSHRLGANEALVKIVRVPSEWGREFRPLVELDQKELIVETRSLE